MTKGITIYEAPTNQRQQLIQHFQSKATITADEAKELYGIGNLKARIFDLRETGHIIYTNMTSFITRLGKKGKFGKYEYKGYTDYVKPAKPDNSEMMSTVKKYAISKAEQTLKTYESRFRAGTLSKEALDKAAAKTEALINFTKSLK